MSKCSHEGHMPGKAGAHLRKMHGMHGHPDHARAHGRVAGAGDHAENENRENRSMERSEERAERKDA